jgi:phosphohistidine phosphatase
MNALCFVRHGIAGERGPAWPDDGLRPLTEEGIRRMEQAARGLASLVPGCPILSSPLVRAWQSAEIVAKALGSRDVRACVPLERGDHYGLLIDAAAIGGETIVAVGHEPHISMCLSWLLSGDATAVALDIKKGAAAMVDFTGPPEPGNATLRWLLPPRVLRDLGAR